LKNARGRDRRQIRKEYLAATTKGGAKHFIWKVAQMTAEIRRSPLPGRAPGIFASLLPTPRRAWVPTPLPLYRKRAEKAPPIRGAGGESTTR
jgi:hypothetical protein